MLSLKLKVSFIITIIYCCILTQPHVCFSDDLFGKFEFNIEMIDNALTLLQEDNNINKDSLLVTLPKTIFQDIYNPELPDLLVILDGKGFLIDPIMIKNAKKENCLWGDRHIWVMIISVGSQWNREYVSSSKKEIKKQGKEKKESVADSIIIEEKIYKHGEIEITISTLDHMLGREEFILSSVIRGIAALFSLTGIAGEAKTAEVKEEEVDSLSLKLIPDAEKKGKHKLYFGMAKFKLKENTINRIGIKLPSDTSDSEEQGNHPLSAYATFGNYSSSLLASSIGLAWTFWEPDSTHHKNKVDPFLFAHIYFGKYGRPQLPRRYYLNNSKCSRIKRFFDNCSYSLVIGTKITGKNFFDDIFIGIGAGHIIGQGGIVAGVNFVSFLNKSGDKDRKGNIMVAITYNL